MQAASRPTRLAVLRAVAAAFALRRTQAACNFIFSSVALGSATPDFAVPAAGGADTLLNDGDPIINADGSYLSEGCSGDSLTWSYDDFANSFSTWTDGQGEDHTVDVFYATGTGDLNVRTIQSWQGAPMYAALRGATLRLALTCAGTTSCLDFTASFTNSWDFSVLSGTSSLYRFSGPAVPGFVLPQPQPESPGDVWLNEGNDIVRADGGDVPAACNGNSAEYLGEDGIWYGTFRGDGGTPYDLNHVFYATAGMRLNAATIQASWSPTLELALAGRLVRLEISCENGGQGVDYLYFTVGTAGDSGGEDGSDNGSGNGSGNGYSNGDGVDCSELEELCSESTSGAAYSGAVCWPIFATVAVSTLAALRGGAPP